MLSIFRTSIQLLILAGGAFSPTYAQSASSPVVDLGHTIHQGILSENGVYYNFSNIRFGESSRFQPPYASQAINLSISSNGDLGRRCPQTHPAWLSVGVKVAQGVPTSELQPPVFNISQIPLVHPEETEDCLFLDVMVPSKIFDSQLRHHSRGFTTRGAPVLVWIYGGGFSAGWKHEQNATGLVTRSAIDNDEGIVYVAMNYRVGMFGFLPAGITGEGASNVGLLDQRLALEWVQNNIHLFGGDSSRVTIMGESAGAGSILHHITAFGSSGEAPFHQAILQSPGFQPMPNAKFQKAILDYALTNASDLIQGTTVNSVGDLRKLSFEDMTLVNQVMVGKSVYGSYTFGPVTDSSFAPDLPGKLLAEGRFTKSLKGLLMGVNKNEGLLMTSPFLENDQDYRNNVRSFILTDSNEVLNYTATTLYPDDLSGKYNYTTEVVRAGLTKAESCFTCNTRYLTEALPNIVSTNVFKYIFSVPPAMHADDLAYTFYNGNGTLTWEGFPAHEETAFALQDYIINFVRRGSPNSMAAKTPQPWFPTYGLNATVFNMSNTTLGELLVDPDATSRCDWWQKAYYA